MKAVCKQRGFDKLVPFLFCKTSSRICYQLLLNLWGMVLFVLGFLKSSGLFFFVQLPKDHAWRPILLQHKSTNTFTKLLKGTKYIGQWLTQKWMNVLLLLPIWEANNCINKVAFHSWLEIVSEQCLHSRLGRQGEFLCIHFFFNGLLLLVF